MSMPQSRMLDRVFARGMSAMDYVSHARGYRSRYPETSPGSEFLAAQIATFNSWRRHNPITGHCEFVPGTPAFVRRIAEQNRW